MADHWHEPLCRRRTCCSSFELASCLRGVTYGWLLRAPLLKPPGRTQTMDENMQICAKYGSGSGPVSWIKGINVVLHPVCIPKVSLLTAYINRANQHACFCSAHHQRCWVIAVIDRGIVPRTAKVGISWAPMRLCCGA